MRYSRSVGSCVVADTTPQDILFVPVIPRVWVGFRGHTMKRGLRDYSLAMVLDISEQGHFGQEKRFHS